MSSMTVKPEVLEPVPTAVAPTVMDAQPAFPSPDVVVFLLWSVFAASTLALGILTGLWIWSLLVLCPRHGLSWWGLVVLFRAGAFLSGALLVFYGLLNCPRGRHSWYFIATGAVFLLVERFFSTIVVLW